MFFAQALSQALDDTSFESFRVPTLDLLARSKEVTRLCNDALAQRVHPAALTAPLHEFCRSLRQSAEWGSVDEDIAAHFYDTYHKRELSKPSEIRYCGNICTNISDHLTRTYKLNLELGICEILPQDDRRATLRAMTYEYAAHLINAGYSKQYIKDILDSSFLKRTIQKIEKRTMPRFFRHFDSIERRYIVWILAGKTTTDYLNNVKITILMPSLLADAPKDVQNALKGGSETNVVRYQAKALDPYAAIERVRRVMKMIASISLLNRKSIELDLPTASYVRTARAKAGMVVETDDLNLQRATRIVRGKTGRAVRRQTNALLSEFDNESFRRLSATLRTGALARTSPNVENQLVSLWSAVEVLFGDPPGDFSRIRFYINQITPLVCHRYMRSYSVAVLDDLLLVHARAVRVFLGGFEPDFETDQYSRFNRLLFTEIYSAERKAFMNIIKDNPLALHRVWKLWDNFRTPLKYKESLESHLDRVSWQVARIYRARNNLVHRGSYPSYLRPLTLNAFEYFRVAVVNILENGMNQDHDSKVENIVSKISLDQAVLLHKLRQLGNSDFPANDDTFQSLFFEGKRVRR